MKVFKNILFVLFLLIAFAYLFILVTPKIFKNFYPFGIRVAIVLTGSMEPELKINDLVVVKQPKIVKEGDIVSYKSPDTRNEVLHRVISINDDEIITKGDANNTEDKPIKRSQITGVYIFKFKYLGKLLVFLTKPLGYCSAILLMIIIMIFPLKK